MGTRLVSIFYRKRALATLLFGALAILFSGFLLYPSGAQAQSTTTGGFTGVRWNTVAPQPYNNSEAQGEVVGGKLYVFGGFDFQKSCCTPTKRAYVYNPAANNWTPVADLPFTPKGDTFGGVTHAGVATDGTNIFIAGGYTSDDAGTGQIFGTRQVWRYNVGSNDYTRLPDLPVERAAGQLEYLDGKLHYIAGTNQARTEDVADHYVLDVANDATSWTTAAPLPNPRQHAASVVLGGKIYYLGGQKGHDGALVPQNDVHVYDPTTDTWADGVDLPKPINHAASSTFVMDGRILVAGGQTNNGTSIADVTAFDPKTGAWTSLTPLPNARNSAVANAIAGNIYFTTGSGTRETLKGVPVQGDAGVKINFQPDSAPVPAGYTKDTGAAYSDARGYGWVRQDSVDGGSNETRIPLDISPNGRDRNLNPDQRLNTLTHMQFPPTSTNATAVKTPAAWEYKLPNGAYEVTVAVGEPQAGQDPESHVINVEGTRIVDGFVPSGANGSATRHTTGKAVVNVSDGELTMDAIGGTNTKPNYVEISPTDATADRPSITSTIPADGATNVARSTSVAANIKSVNDGVDDATLDSNTVRLFKVDSDGTNGAQVDATYGTSGGNDVINLIPKSALEANTKYRFEVTDGVKDLDGLAFRPYTMSFTTGSALVFNPPGVTDGDVGSAAFEKVAQPNVPNKTFTSVTMGPDGKLYAGTIGGEIYRFPVESDGDLGTPEIINTVRSNNGDAQRIVMGLTFEPGSTAENPRLWITHSTYGFNNMADWGGKLSVLSGANLGAYRDVLTNLPRSSKDHLSNSIAFHDGKLYMNQGANTAMGAYDTAWKGTERLLSAAVLEVDYKNISDTLDVKTADGGAYNPYAASAPVKVYASGVRNAVDLVWHTNGQLYAPTNGSAANGAAPATPSNFADLPQCKNRTDGAYTGPAIPEFDGGTDGRMTITKTQDDYLFRVVRGGYYGNPNPSRCEWVLNGGNPTSAADPGENPEYPVGTMPDRNWRGWAYDFANNKSPNGVIEYRSDNFGGKLKGKLLVARYSGGQDIVVLHPNGTSGDIDKQNIGVPGLSGLYNPLDLTEDTRNGNLYVTEGVTNPPDNKSGKITLLRAGDAATRPQNAEADKSRLIFNAVQNAASAQQTVSVRNSGRADLRITGATLSGTDAGKFRISAKPAGEVALASGQSQQFGVTFNPTAAGPQGASLDIATDDPDTPVVKVNLRGLGTLGTGGSNEPSLQWILDTYEIPVNVGDPDKTNNSMPTDATLGDEIKAQLFQKAGSGDVTVEPLAVFGPDANNPVLYFGRYAPGNAGSTQELFSVSNDPKSNAQTLNVPGGTRSFDPGTASFGLYSQWPFFQNRKVFSEDALNTFTGAIPHHVRVYPLKDKGGVVEQNAYVVATEETTSGFDYQDVVVVVRNVKPAAPASKAEIELENLDGVPFPDRLVFNRIQTPNAQIPNGVHDVAKLRIKNTGTDPLNVIGLPITGPWGLVSGPTLPAAVPAGGQLDLTVKFVAQNGAIHNGTLTIQSDDADEPSTKVELSGFWQSVSEGGQEPDVAEITKVFGYGTAILNSGQKLNNAGRVEAIGDEVLSPYWKRADTTKPVAVRQLAAFHTQGNTATAYWHAKGSNTTSQIVRHAGVDGQSLLPRKDGQLSQPAAGPFTPSATTFGFKIDSEWSDPDKNNKNPDRQAGCNDNVSAGGTDKCGHHVRFWPAKDRAGKPIPNTYLMVMDYAGINYDYNDNGYLISNIRPENLPAPSSLKAVSDDGKVSLSWDSLVQSGQVGYNVYRGASATVDTSGTPLNGATPLTGTSYTDTAVQNGATYYYVVQAVEGTTKSSPSNVVQATPTKPGTTTDFKVNFQSAAAAVPQGYLRDYGQPYGPRSDASQGQGMTYGWVAPGTNNPRDLSVGGSQNLGNGRERNLNSDQRLDTLMHMQADDVANFNGTPLPGSWEASLPNGKYKVTVAAGDASVGSDPESHTINVEGVNAINNFLPGGAEGSATRHKTAAVTVDVSDGKLTLDAEGGNGLPAGTNTKIDYVEVEKATTDTTAPAAPAGLTATAGDARVNLTWNANADTDLAGYNVYRSTSEQVNTSGTPLNGATLLTGTSYEDTGLTNGTKYYYAVVAIDKSGNKSSPSATASATPQAGQGPATQIKVNFQNAAASVPQGYFEDHGQPYGARTEADQGAGSLTYGWISPSTGQALDLSVGGSTPGNGRDRGFSERGNPPLDQRLDTIMHMQANNVSGTFNGTAQEGAWEVAVPDGAYDVTVSVGDPTADGNAADTPRHTIRVEGQTAISNFQSAGADGSLTRHKSATVQDVRVADGKLTVDAQGGFNTKINHIDITGESPTNEAPTVEKPADQTGKEGDAVNLQVRATDPENGTLTYAATGLPSGLSINPSTGLISGAIATGAAKAEPYAVTVTATDDGSPAKSGSASFSWTVGAAGPAGCSPYSILPCEEIPVALPHDLLWDADEGGLADGDGQGTGFTMVQPSSNGGKSLPERLDAANGRLVIKTTKGIQYKTATTTTNGNSLDNGLGVGFDSTKPVKIETTLVNPPATGNTSEQGGLWFGPDEDNYAKLVVAAVGANSNRVQLLREVNGASAAPADEVNATGQNLTGSTVRLILETDPQNGKVKASYAVNGGAVQSLGELTVPASFFDGTKVDAKTNLKGFAGIFATHRNAATTTGLDFAFDGFSVAAVEQPAPNRPPVLDQIGAQSVTIGERKTVAIRATDPDAGDAIKLTAQALPGFATFTDGGDGTGTLELAPGAQVTPGTYEMTVTATDGAGATDSETFVVTVNEVPNRPPTVTRPADQSAIEGSAYALRIAASDPDEGDTLTYSASGLPAGLSIDPATGEISGTIAPDTAGGSPYTVTVTVSDGTDSASASFAFEVEDRLNALSADPGAVDFGGVEVGKQGNEKVVLTNGGNVAVKVESVSVAGADAGRFSVSPSGPATIEPSGTLELNVGFAPDGEGAMSANLVVTHDGGNSPVSIALSGEGVAAPDTTAPAAVTNFVARAGDAKVDLSWTEPADLDLAAVRVLRSEVGYASGPEPGAGQVAIFEGRGTSFVNAGLQNGKVYYFTAFVRDAAGNWSAAAQATARPVAPPPPPDRTAPETRITSGPAGLVKVRSARFYFVSTEARSTFECRVDGRPFVRCASPQLYGGLRDGRHVFEVRAVDAAGNRDATPARRVWFVDATKPIVSRETPRPNARTRDRTPAISALVRDGSTNLSRGNMRLYVDGKPVGFSYNRASDRLFYVPKRNLSYGKHSVRIVVTDAAGNRTVEFWRFTVVR
jgi:hypothetical protein